MSFHTFDPVPTGGGTFAHDEKRFAATKIDDDRCIIVYHQVAPFRMYAQVVTFNGTETPVFETAYSILGPEHVSSVNVNNSNFHAYPRIKKVRENMYMVGFVYYMSNPDSATGYAKADAESDSEFLAKFITISVNNSNEITVNDTPKGNNQYHEAISYDFAAVKEGVVGYVWRKHQDGSTDPDVVLQELTVDVSGQITLGTQHVHSEKYNLNSNSDHMRQGIRCSSLYDETNGASSGHFVTNTARYNGFYWNGTGSPIELSTGKIRHNLVEIRWMSSGYYIHSDASGSIFSESAADLDAHNEFDMYFASGVLTPTETREGTQNIIRMDNQHAAIISRNKVAGGASKLWFVRFGFDDPVMDVEQNSSGPFSIPNAPIVSASLDDYGQLDNDANWHTIGHYDATNGVLRIIGPVKAGTDIKIGVTLVSS